MTAPTNVAFDAAARLVRDIDIMAPLLDVMPAWLAFQLVESRSSGVRLSTYNDPETPLLDLAIAARAERAGVSVVPLETLDEQIARGGTPRTGLVSGDAIVEDPVPAQFFFRDPDGNRFLIVQPG